MATKKSGGRNIAHAYVKTVSVCKTDDGNWTQTDTCYSNLVCGCRVVGGGNLLAPFTVKHCAKHAAASDLLEAARDMVSAWDEFCTEEGGEEGGLNMPATQVAKLRAAIAKAQKVR